MEDAELPKKRTWLRWFMRFLVVACVGVILLLLFAGSLVDSDFVRGRISQELSRRSGLTCTVEELELEFPWSVSARGVHVAQPDGVGERLVDPLLEIESVFLSVQKHPDRWTLRPRKLVVTKPRGVMTVQTLVSLVKNPDVKVAQPSGEVPVPIPVPQVPPPSRPGTEATEKLDADPPPMVVPSGEAVLRPPPQRQPVGPTVDVVVAGGSFRLVDGASGETLCSLADLDISLPISGEDRDGSVTWGAVVLLGEESSGEGDISARWERPWLSLQETNGTFLGVDYAVVCRASPQLAMPVNCRVVVPEQSFGAGADPVTIERFSGLGSFSGLLKAPVTWRGQFSASGEEIAVKDPFDGSAVVFDTGRVAAAGNALGVVFPQFSLRGDEAVLLGNAMAARNGEANATVRLIATDQITAGVNQVAERSGLAELGRPWMRATNTPDLKVRDMHFTNHGGQAWCDVSDPEGWVPLGALKPLAEALAPTLFSQ